MKGLLRKDLYLIWFIGKSYFFMDLVFIVVSFFAGGRGMFFLLYPCIVSSLLPVSLVSWDEKEKWDVYAGTLPCTRKDLVTAKYLVGLGLSGGVLLLIAAVQAASMAAGSGLRPGEYVTLLLVFAAVCLSGPAFLLPFVFKLGAEKGRIAYYAMIALFCGAAAFANVSADAGADDGLGALLGSACGPAALACLAAMALYAGSWALSVAFYQKRDL